MWVSYYFSAFVLISVFHGVFKIPAGAFYFFVRSLFPLLLLLEHFYHPGLLPGEEEDIKRIRKTEGEYCLKPQESTPLGSPWKWKCRESSSVNTPIWSPKPTRARYGSRPSRPNGSFNLQKGSQPDRLLVNREILLECSF